MKSFLTVGDKIGLKSLFIAVVTPAAGTDEAAAEAFVDLTAQAFGENKKIGALEYKGAEIDLVRFMPVLLRHLPQLLSYQDLKNLPDLLSDENIRRKVKENRKLLLTPFGFSVRDLVLADPLGLTDLFGHRLSLPDGSMIHKSHQGYYRSDNGSYFLFAKPINPPQDIAFSKALMQDAAKIAARVSKAGLQSIPDLVTSPDIAFTGGYAIAVNDEAVTKVDIQVALVGSIIGVLLLFGLCFRTVKIMVYICIPLLMSIVWTLGLASLLFGHLNLLTCIFSCVLAGLGVDFGIHIVNRFYSPDKKAKDFEYRLRTTFQETGGGVIVGALTTSAAFYAVGFSDFRGFRELGIMTGSGLLLCLLAMLFVLPSLMVHGYKQHRIHVAGFALKRLLVRIAGRPWRVLSIFCVICALLVMIGLHVRFDDNLKNFRSPENKALQLQDELTQWLGGSSAPAMIVVSDTSERKCLTTGSRIFDAMLSLKEKDLAADVIGLSAFLPSPEDQQSNLDYVAANKNSFAWLRVRKTFEQALAQNGLQPLAAYESYFDTLEKAFADNSLFLPSDLGGTPLQSILKLFYFKDNDAFHTIVYVRPKADLWLQREARAFKQTLESELSRAGIEKGHYVVTGAHLLSSELKAIIIKNMGSALLLACAAIIILLLLYYRNVLLVIGALTPITASLAILSGIMVLFGIDFNFVNVLVLPMIVGIGIDDGVHLSNTFISDGYRYSHSSLARTGRGVVITTLTTMVGFGSLSFSHYPGLRSMGYVAAIGVGACLLTSLLLLPALFSIIGRNRS